MAEFAKALVHDTEAEFWYHPDGWYVSREGWVGGGSLKESKAERKSAGAGKKKRKKKELVIMLGKGVVDQDEDEGEDDILDDLPAWTAGK